MVTAIPSAGKPACGCGSRTRCPSRRADTYGRECWCCSRFSEWPPRAIHPRRRTPHLYRHISRFIEGGSQVTTEASGDIKRSLEPITYSALSMFKNCRRKYRWRYIKELAPIAADPALYFGQFIHDCLELWHESRCVVSVQDYITGSIVDRATKLNAAAMMDAYMLHYQTERWSVVALEKPFEATVVNPTTGAASRSFVMRGKVDGIVCEDGRNYILEHKTASRIDAAYIDRLWTDFQSKIYAHFISEALGIKIHGVEYNILTKARLTQKQGESEAEFEARRADLAAANKSGKSTAKRQLPESDEDFRARLDAFYEKPGTFHRERLYFSREDFEELRGELWELTQQLLDARRRDAYYANSSQCFSWGKPCPYWKLCSNPKAQDFTIETEYQHKPAHDELADDPAPAEPAF